MKRTSPVHPFPDKFTEDHLDAWLAKEQREQRHFDAVTARQRIVQQLKIDPSQVDRLGWPEILILAIRNECFSVNNQQPNEHQ